MIFWYSGTGNSRLVAERLAELLDDKMSPIIGGGKINPESTDESVGYVFPVYSWGVPPIVLRHIEHVSSRLVNGPSRGWVWMVCTCGDETGMAPRMFERAAAKCGLKVTGMWSVQMPNNYVLLPGFGVDTEWVAEEKLRSCELRIAGIAESIKNLKPGSGTTVIDCELGPWPRLKTWAVYPLFKRWGVFPKRWHATEACTGCGICVKACPSNNISMRRNPECGHDTPQWGEMCLSCTACYHACPVNAVQYGGATKGKGQYSLAKTLKALKARR